MNECAHHFHPACFQRTPVFRLFCVCLGNGDVSLVTRDIGFSSEGLYVLCSDVGVSLGQKHQSLEMQIDSFQGPFV